MVARKANNRSVASTDSALNSVSAQDSASKRKVVKPKIEFNHEALRVALAKARKGLKLSLKYASEACGIADDRLRDLERGYKPHTPELVTKFNVHELLSVCLAFDLDIWSFTIMPVQMSMIEGSNAERRDRAWAEAQIAWQQIAELRVLLSKALSGRISGAERRKALDLCKMPPAGTVGVG